MSRKHFSQNRKVSDIGARSKVLGGAMSVLTSGFTTTASTPDDNTIPQITEGAQVLSVTYTPHSATSELFVTYGDFGAAGASGVASGRVMHMHRDSDANAIAAAYSTLDATGETRAISMAAKVPSNSKTATSFSVRAGAGGGGTTQVGRAPSIGNVFGAISKAYIQVIEVEP